MSGIWWFSDWCLMNVWWVSYWCLGVSGGCQEGLVGVKRTNKSSLLWGCLGVSGRNLNSVWRVLVWWVSGLCMEIVFRVSGGGCLDGMWTVCEEYLEGERLKGLGQSPQICTVRQCGTSTFDFFFRNVLWNKAFAYLFIWARSKKMIWAMLHWRLSSTEGRLPPKVVLHRRPSSTKGCPPTIPNLRLLPCLEVA